MILCSRSEPYDPYLPRNGSSSAGQGQGNPKTAAIQAQIDDTVGIMRDNITKVAERGERLDSLQDKTGEFVHFALFIFLFGFCLSFEGLMHNRHHLVSHFMKPFDFFNDCLVVKDIATDTWWVFFLDNLAVSAQGFRRGANRVRKVRLVNTLVH